MKKENFTNSNPTQSKLFQEMQTHAARAHERTTKQLAAFTAPPEALDEAVATFIRRATR